MRRRNWKTGREVMLEKRKAVRNKAETGRLKILDWYVHQGHQYEFFKLNHDFYLAGVDSLVPKWNAAHRPLGKNVRLISEKQAFNIKFDVVMVRSPLNQKRYQRFINQGAIPIAVVQTTTPFRVNAKVRHIVWNSFEVMQKVKRFYGNKNNHHILHGYDPDEFCQMNIGKNDKVLLVANAFRKRSDIMGYHIYKELLNRLGNLYVLGHDNSEVPNSIGQAKSLQELLRCYNQYSIFLNTTLDSAMPRSRAEAAMCGMPIISTNNFGISRYFRDKKSAILTNDIREMESYINKFLESDSMREDFGAAAREVAIKHFHIKDYLQKWEELLKTI